MRKIKPFLAVGLFTVLLCGTLRAACGGPDAEYLKEFLSGDADFYALFDSSVGWDADFYEITSVIITNQHEENKDSTDMTGNISCQSEEAIYMGSFALVLKKYNGGWDADEMYLLDEAFSMRGQLTAEKLESMMDLYLGITDP